MKSLMQRAATGMFRANPQGLAILVVVFFVSPCFADVPVPQIPKAKGKQCVEDTAFMRRNHMELLKHQRDKTLRQGMRQQRHSLNDCLNCHAVMDVDNTPVNYGSDKHFCNSCHQYAAVKIDCFDCHASTPGDDKAITGKSL